MPLLEVENLRVAFRFGRDRWLSAVEGVSFSLELGETVALVGESGCGKSATALALFRLLPEETARVSADRLVFDGVDLLTAAEATLRSLRGRRVGYVFQEPMTALNPVYPIGEQIAETLRVHRGLSRAEARAAAEEALRRVHMPSPRERMDAYPHQLSGGMRQRALIAMAIACSPKLLILDEPTTALDVTVQAQILDLFRELQETLGVALLLITHDLGVVAEIADRVLVMYAGHLVEEAPVEELFERPLHPYTRGLLNSMPRADGTQKRLEAIPGTVPDLGERPAGCPFAPRCSWVQPECRQAVPPLEPQPTVEHRVRCFALLESGEYKEKVSLSG